MSYVVARSFAEWPRLAGSTRLEATWRGEGHGEGLWWLGAPERPTPPLTWGTLAECGPWRPPVQPCVLP